MKNCGAPPSRIYIAHPGSTSRCTIKHCLYLCKASVHVCFWQVLPMFGSSFFSQCAPGLEPCLGIHAAAHPTNKILIHPSVQFPYCLSSRCLSGELKPIRADFLSKNKSNLNVEMFATKVSDSLQSKKRCHEKHGMVVWGRSPYLLWLTPCKFTKCCLDRSSRAMNVVLSHVALAHWSLLSSPARVFVPSTSALSKSLASHATTPGFMWSCTIFTVGTGVMLLRYKASPHNKCGFVCSQSLASYCFVHILLCF